MFVIITVAIDMLAFGLIIPVVPTLVQELGNISAERATLYIGGLGTTYAFMNFLFGPMLGALSDRFGRRPVLLASIATLSIDFLIMGFANSIWLLFLGRALSGISGATYSTANAYIADVTEPENRGKAFGMVGAAFGFGFIFGPVMGGILGEFDPRAPFFAAAALALLNFCYGFFVLPESLEEEHRRPFVPSRSNPFGAVKHFSKLPHVSWFLVSAGVFFLAHTVYPSLGLVGLGAAVVQAGLIGIALKRFGAVRTALYGIIINALALFAYAFAGFGWVVFLIIPIGALGGVASPTLNSLMSTVTPKNAQGELQGASASLNSFAMIFGPMIMAGALFYFTEPGTPLHFPGAAFLLAGILTAFSIIPFLRVRSAHQCHR